MNQNELERYNAEAHQRHKENQELHLAGIKGRYLHLNIEWDLVIEKEAMRRDGGGITHYLRQVSKEQEQVKQARYIEWLEQTKQYGEWS